MVSDVCSCADKRQGCNQKLASICCQTTRSKAMGKPKHSECCCLPLVPKGHQCWHARNSWLLKDNVCALKRCRFRGFHSELMMQPHCFCWLALLRQVLLTLVQRLHLQRCIVQDCNPGKLHDCASHQSCLLSFHCIFTMLTLQSVTASCRAVK